MKTFASNLFALSSLTAFIVTLTASSVDALSISSGSHMVRHLSHAHAVEIKRSDNVKRCRTRQPPITTNPGNPTNPNPPSTGTGGPKKGLAFPQDCADINKWRPFKDTWWHYNWRTKPWGNCPGGSPGYVPMLWGWEALGDFKWDTSQNVPTHALGCNEPDLFDNKEYSSGIDPWSAADLWRQGMEPLKAKGVRLGACATTSSPDGLKWMEQFLQACNGCTVDFMPLHWYGTSVEEFQTYVETWWNRFKKPIWITEMACHSFTGGAQCSEWQIQDMIARINHWLEERPYVERYAWFGTLSNTQNVNPMNKMMDDYGGPNWLGNYNMDHY